MCRSGLGVVAKFHPNYSHVPPIIDGKIMGGSWEDHGKITKITPKLNWDFTEASPKSQPTIFEPSVSQKVSETTFTTALFRGLHQVKDIKFPLQLVDLY